MSCHSVSPLRRACFVSGLALLVAVSASAQSAPTISSNPQIGSNESSSAAFQPGSDDGVSGAPALRDAAASLGSGGGAAGGQGQQDTGGHHGMFHGLAFEAGGGFSAPIGNDTPYISWGGNFTGGAGLHFSRRISLLGEFQFMDNKLPGALVAAGGGQTGNAHIISITADPVIDLFPKSANSVYITGGGGYYHKSTNFNIEECCDFYGYPVTVTANSFSSNQAGGNIGLGFTHRLGGVYGDGTMKLFAEARYVFINTPPITASNGLGTTELIPVTLGIRF
jgi:hypothetical protein